MLPRHKSPDPRASRPWPKLTSPHLVALVGANFVAQGQSPCRDAERPRIACRRSHLTKSLGRARRSTAIGSWNRLNAFAHGLATSQGAGLELDGDHFLCCQSDSYSTVLQHLMHHSNYPSPTGLREHLRRMPSMEIDCHSPRGRVLSQRVTASSAQKRGVSTGHPPSPLPWYLLLCTPLGAAGKEWQPLVPVAYDYLGDLGVKS